jgi:hypothetical protein
MARLPLPAWLGHTRSTVLSAAAVTVVLAVSLVLADRPVVSAAGRAGSPDHQYAPAVSAHPGSTGPASTDPSPTPDRRGKSSHPPDRRSGTVAASPTPEASTPPGTGPVTPSPTVAGITPGHSRAADPERTDAPVPAVRPRLQPPAATPVGEPPVNRPVPTPAPAEPAPAVGTATAGETFIPTAARPTGPLDQPLSLIWSGMLALGLAVTGVLMVGRRRRQW